MLNKFLWKRARVIDSSLQGENWPEKLTLAQIAKQLFPDSDDQRKLLLSFMNEQVEDGGLEFNDVRVSPKWHSSNVSLSIVGDNALYASIREDSRKSREMDLLKMHEPVFGWVEGLKGTELNNPIKLEKHLCGCNSECTIEKSYRNGLPKRWRVEGVHDDGLKISFSCESEPLISANQCRDFLGSVNQYIPVDSTLNGWGGDLKLQFQVGGNEIEGQAVTEPVSANSKLNVEPGNNEKRMKILKAWYLTLCTKHKENREFIMAEINNLTNTEIKNELKNITPQDEKYLWTIKQSDRWIMDNGSTVWGFKKTQGGKAKIT